MQITELVLLLVAALGASLELLVAEDEVQRLLSFLCSSHRHIMVVSVVAWRLLGLTLDRRQTHSHRRCRLLLQVVPCVLSPLNGCLGKPGTGRALLYRLLALVAGVVGEALSPIVLEVTLGRLVVRLVLVLLHDDLNLSDHVFLVYRVAVVAEFW